MIPIEELILHDRHVTLVGWRLGGEDDENGEA